jgi:hypothetical protein
VFKPLFKCKLFNNIKILQMPFEKGHNHSTGRPKGSTNKVSKEIREVSALLLQGQLEALQDKLPTLKDSDYIKAIGLLMKHVLPAQKQIEVDTIQHPTEITVEILERLETYTDEDVHDAILTNSNRK